MAVDVRNQFGPLEALVRAIADRKERPTPWVDATTYPWSDPDFSKRYVRRADYAQQIGMNETGEEVESLISALQAKPKARILDLCAGNGRHAVGMALRGFRMTGIDIGPGAVALARETAKNLGLAVDFRELDVCDLAIEDAYDGAYLTCGGLSDFAPADCNRLLAVVERALVSGGRAAIEFADAASAAGDVRAWQFVQAESSLFTDVPNLQLEERLYDADASAEVIRHYVVPTDGKIFEIARCRRYFTDAAIREAMTTARFGLLEVVPGSAPGLKKIIGIKN
ncbi:MAG TPA: class I SAM-dependent methyltransferase [Candidatus Eremiobacteraceae bacterium]